MNSEIDADGIAYNSQQLHECINSLNSLNGLILEVEFRGDP